MDILTFWTSHRAELVGMLQQHLLLVIIATGVATLLGVPAGILAVHRPRLGRPLVALANIAQTIPSLALLGFLLPLPLIGGVGPRIAVIALILYALLPIVRSTAAGLSSIERSIIDAGIAMGMTQRQLLMLVELPLALPSIVAGVRVATVLTIGTATIAAAVGAGGLGEYIFRGLSMVDGTVILAGAIPAALLALAADAGLTWAERRLRREQRRSGRLAPLGVAAAAVAVVVLLVVAAARDTRGVVVASKNFTEQVVLGELIAQSLERQGVAVTRRLNLGGTFICDRAIRSGDVDVYVEYTGTALTAILKEPVQQDGDAVLTRVRERYAAQGLSVLPPLGFNNTFAILVRRGDADTLGLRTVGDLQKMRDRWRAAFGYEFLERADGYPGLAAAYGLSFAAAPRAMDLSLVYRALAGGEVDVVNGDSTSGLIDALDLAVLEDDRAYFPPYHAVPIVRSAVLLREPAVRRALERLAGRLSDADMRRMNRAVDVEKQDVAVVVRRVLDDLAGR